jgi:hypothetical protein
MPMRPLQAANLGNGEGQPVKEVVPPRIDPVNGDAGQDGPAARMKASSRSLYGAPVEGTV